MRLHRFFVDQDIEKGKDIRIENQWTKVFRLSASDRVVIFNGNGKDFEGYFKILSRKEAVIAIDKEKKVKSAVSCELHIFQSIIKKDNFEFVVEKCTEIGAAAFHPILTERSEKKDLNIERVKKIATEASEQSGRGTVPEIFEPTDLQTAIGNFDGKLFTMDFDGEKLSGEMIGKYKKIGILIGPEGGFTDTERDFFEDQGIEMFSVGEQVLRAETAAIVVSALILLQ